MNQKAVVEKRLRLFPIGTILFPKSGASTFLNHRVVIGEPAHVSSHLAGIVCKEQKALPKYVYHLLCQVDTREITPDQAYPSLRLKEIGNIQIPLPPLEVQQEIVAAIEGYQKVIDGARAVVKNYQPRIAVDPEWPVVVLGDTQLFQIESGGTPRSNIEEYWDRGIPWITLVDLPPEDSITEITSTKRTISHQGLRNSSARVIPANSIVVSSRATIGRIGINRIPLATNQGFKNIVLRDMNRAIPEYIALAALQLVPTMIAQASGATYKEITKTRFCTLQIPLPPIEIQQTLVAEIQAEQALVKANRELMQRFKQKIRDVIARVWDEPPPS